MEDNIIFINAQENFLKTKEKKYWDIMFLQVLKCCEVQGRKYCVVKGINIEDGILHDRILKATILIMSRYKKKENYKINFLVTVCKNAIFDVMTRKNDVINDRALSWDEIVANYMMGENKNGDIE